jgi:acetyl esterase
MSRRPMRPASTADVLYYRDTYKGGDSKLPEPLRETDYSAACRPPSSLRPDSIRCMTTASTMPRRLTAPGVPAEVRDEPLLVHAFLRARNMSVPARASFNAITAACASLSASRQTEFSWH